MASGVHMEIDMTVQRSTDRSRAKQSSPNARENIPNMEKQKSSTHERLDSGNQTNRDKLEGKIKTKNTKLVIIISMEKTSPYP